MIMTSKLTPAKPFLMILYGYPGSGKTFFARQMSEELNNTVHLHADKLQSDLSQELSSLSQSNGSFFNTIIKYMAQEYLNNGISVIADVPVNKKSDRRAFKALALANKALPILIWLQIDAESSFVRVKKRDRRKYEDKYAPEYTPDQFQEILSGSQNPNNENFTVISGKHTFKSQRAAILKKLYEQNIIKLDDSTNRLVKPELVNLIPKLQARGHVLKRNISIR